VFVGFVELLNELACVKDTIVWFPGVVGVAVSFPLDVEGKLLAMNLLQLFVSRDRRPVVQSRGMACAALRVATRLLCAWRDSYG
jgi:hypothetical protein